MKAMGVGLRTVARLIGKSRWPMPQRSGGIKVAKKTRQSDEQLCQDAPAALRLR
jgi:hypothetical protein